MKKVFHMHITYLEWYIMKIIDEKKDMGPLVQAEEKFRFIEKNYPETDFALDSVIN